jgi:hypothetical protein
VLRRGAQGSLDAGRREHVARSRYSDQIRERALEPPAVRRVVMQT